MLASAPHRYLTPQFRPVVCTAVLTGMLFLLPMLAQAQRFTAMPSLFAFAHSGMHTQKGQTPGYLGVEIRDMTDDLANADHLKAHSGVEVFTVDHDGPAAKSGLRVRDVITQLNGQPVPDADAWRRVMRDMTPGRQTTFVVCRDGSLQTLSAQLVNREELERQAWRQHLTVPDPSASSTAAHGNGFFSRFGTSTTAAPKITGTHQGVIGSVLMGSSYTGAMMETMSPQLADFFGAPVTSLMVRSVDAGSPAAQAGMRAGDVVLRVNALPIRTGSDWTKAVHENRGKPTPVIILRDKHEKTLTLTPDDKRRSAVEFFGPPLLNPTEEARLCLPACYWIEY